MKRKMTKEELSQLRQDIRLNSLFIKDYKNRFNIDPEVVCGFFSGYVDCVIQSEVENENLKGTDDEKLTTVLRLCEDSERMYNFYEDCISGGVNGIMIDEPEIFVFNVTETFSKQVAIKAMNKDEAADYIEDLCNVGDIDVMNCKFFTVRNVSVDDTPYSEDMELFDAT